MAEITEQQTPPGPSTGPVPGALVLDSVGPLTDLLPFSIRNGTMAQAKSLLVKPTIGAGWHWRQINGLPTGQAIRYVSGFIRTAMAGLTLSAPPGMSPTIMRKAAIVLGTTRAVSTALYELTTADFIPGELSDPLLNAVAIPGVDQEYALVPISGIPLAAKQVLDTPMEFSDLEKAVIVQVHMSAIGMLPLQGYSLIMTQHHYLSDTKSQSYKAYDVVERQHWKSATVETWFSTDLATIQDAMWHKAGHPVLMSLKTQWAYNSTVAQMLKTAGAGTAASRLPASESEMRAANSYRTVMQTVRPMFEMYGGSIDFSILDLAIETVKSFPYGSAMTRAEANLSAGVPTMVVDRNTALEWLKSILDNNSDTAAYCYGFYCALTDQNVAMGAGSGKNTLKTAYSLAKLQDQSLASYTEGQNAFGDYNSARAKMRSEGKYTPPKFTLD